MKQFLLTQLWFSLIVLCEIVKWQCAAKLVKILPWIR